MTVADTDLFEDAEPSRQSIAVGMARGVADYAVARGAERSALLATAGLTAIDHLDPNRRLPLARYIRLVRAASAACDDPGFAINFARETNFADLSIVGLIGYASETMRDALDQLNRFGRLVSDINIAGRDRFTLTYEDDGLWVTDHRIDNPHFPELTEMTFVRMVTGTRQFGDTRYAFQAQVTHADRGTRATLETALGVPVQFGASRNAMRISAAWQSYRIALYPRYAFALFCDHAAGLLAALDAAQTVAGQVERALLPILHTGALSQTAMARKLGYSEQGLYRALRSEGTHFEAVLANLRHRFAKSYLRGGQTTLKEIAYLLGYSDVSAFSRAFKRLEGASPGTYRAAGR